MKLLVGTVAIVLLLVGCTNSHGRSGSGVTSAVSIRPGGPAATSPVGLFGTANLLLPDCTYDVLRFAPVTFPGDFGYQTISVTVTAARGRTCQLVALPTVSLNQGGRSMPFPVRHPARLPLTLSSTRAIALTAIMSQSECHAADNPPTITVSEPGWAYAYPLTFGHCTLAVWGLIVAASPQ